MFIGVFFGFCFHFLKFGIMILKTFVGETKGNQFLVDLLAPNLDPFVIQMFTLVEWTYEASIYLDFFKSKRMSFLPVYHGESLLTPRKFNIAPKNRQSQKETSIPTIIFQGLC